MSLLLISFISLLLLPSIHSNKTIEADKQQAQEAFAFLNAVRANPENYYKELHYKKNVKVSPIKLQWNDTLAQVAEAKALDMAKRNYFAHVDPDRNGINYLVYQSGYELNPDWIKKRKDNYFESISVNPNSGREAISKLIIDANEPSLGHRKHLLGLDAWNSTLKDIGIGFVCCNAGCCYKTYVCVIIAKHNW